MSCVIPFDDALIAGPALEPIDLDEVKKAIRFTSTSEDTLIDAWISAARQMFEHQTGRQLMLATRSRTWRGTVDAGFALELPNPPLHRVVSITYDDGAGGTATMDADSYEVVTANDGPDCRRGFVRLLTGGVWPTTRALTVTYECGYGDAPGDVPELVKAALYQMVGQFHQFRTPVYQGGTSNSLQAVPFGMEMILNAFKHTASAVLPPARGEVWS